MPSVNSIDQLVEFLTGHPDVHSYCEVAGYPSQDLTYRTYKDGGMWFRDALGKDVYLPINCNKTPMETGVDFRPEGFDLTKFGITIHYDYV